MSSTTCEIYSLARAGDRHACVYKVVFRAPTARRTSRYAKKFSFGAFTLACVCQVHLLWNRHAETNGHVLTQKSFCLRGKTPTCCIVHQGRPRNSNSISKYT